MATSTIVLLWFTLQPPALRPLASEGPNVPNADRVVHGIRRQEVPILAEMAQTKWLCEILRPPVINVRYVWICGDQLWSKVSIHKLTATWIHASRVLGDI